MFQIRYGNRFFFLRGDHDADLQMNMNFGFYSECLQKFAGNETVYCKMYQMLMSLPLLAVVKSPVPFSFFHISPNLFMLIHFNYP